MAGVKRTLAVELAGLGMATPVMIAAGCAGTGRELTGLVDLRKVGAVVSRTITVQPRKGTPTPRIAESRVGDRVGHGLQNPGLDAFVAEELPRLARHATPVVVSIGGGTLEEFVRLTSALQGRAEVAAIEVFLGLRRRGARRARCSARTPTGSGRSSAPSHGCRTVPVFAKLPGGAGSGRRSRAAAARAGASGVTASASPPAVGGRRRAPARRSSAA